MSADGRFVAFDSAASNLVANDTNACWDVFIRDRLSGTTERLTVSSAGEQGNGPSSAPAISADGRYVAFASDASDLAPGDTNGVSDIFVRDRLDATTERVSVSTAGEQANGSCNRPSVSADGVLLAFDSAASNLVPGDTNGALDVFVRYRATGETVRVSVTSDGTEGNHHSCCPVLSGNGRYVLFDSIATNLSDEPGAGLFTRDLQTGGTRPVPPSGGWLNAYRGGSISFDGLVIAFTAEYLEECDHAYCYWGVVRVWDARTGEFHLAGCRVNRDPSVSSDGRFVASAACTPSQIVLYDPFPPLLSDLAINAGADWTDSRAATLSYTCGAHCTQVQFCNKGEDWSAWEACTGTKAWTLSPGAGVKRVEAQCKDAVGSLSPVVADTICLSTFADVTCSNPALLYVEALARAGITIGCSGNPPLYCPYNNITRAQVAVFLCRAAGKGPLDRATPTFCDVPKTSPYYGWIERLADADSWGGNPPTIGCLWFPCRKFCPFTAVLRDEMAAFLVRATGKTPMPSCSRVFYDVSPGSWACPYIERMADPASWPGGQAVTSGCLCPSGYPQGSKCYCPKSAVTRGQMAVFLVRAFGIPL
jgi:Tol biopolymer transport system component